jgi:hypothetical protein
MPNITLQRPSTKMIFLLHALICSNPCFQRVSVRLVCRLSGGGERFHQYQRPRPCQPTAATVTIDSSIMVTAVVTVTPRRATSHISGIQT